MIRMTVSTKINRVEWAYPGSASHRLATQFEAPLKTDTPRPPRAPGVSSGAPRLGAPPDPPGTWPRHAALRCGRSWSAEKGPKVHGSALDPQWPAIRHG